MSAPPETPAPAIQSVERAARMLGLFTAEEPRLTLAELTQRMGMSKATVHRYATALRNAGLLRAAAGAYTLGPRVVELATAALAAPVFQGAEIVATMALVGTTSSVETGSDGPMARALRDAAENLSTELGFVEPDRR